MGEIDLQPNQDAASDGGVFRLRHALRQHVSLFQAIIGALAGLMSISGAVYSFVRPIAATPTTGQVVALVKEANSARPVTGATIEVLTPKYALVTTLLTENGRAHQTLREGVYRLRVTYPRFDPQVRQILVLGGQTAEIRLALDRHVTPVAPVAENKRAASEGGLGAIIRRVFQ